MSALRPAVFLDRDGTLNATVLREGTPCPPRTLDEFRLMPGVVEGCIRLRDAGFALVLVTNQPDVGRGVLGREAVEAIHRRLSQFLTLDRIEVCYDPGRGETSEFRKPRPGMILRAAEELGLDLARSWMVGDRWRDVDCGVNAGVRTVFIDHGYAEPLRARPTVTVRHFTAAIEAILGS